MTDVFKNKHITVFQNNVYSYMYQFLKDM